MPLQYINKSIILCLFLLLSCNVFNLISVICYKSMQDTFFKKFIKGVKRLPRLANKTSGKSNVKQSIMRRRTPEMMLDAMNEKKQQLENAVLRNNKEFIYALGLTIIKMSNVNPNSIKTKDPDIYNAIVKEHDTPEAIQLIKDIINKI